MRQILYSLILVLALSLPCRAQQNLNSNYRDSLVRVLTGKNTDSIKARVSFLLSDDWSYSDTLKSKHYLAQGRKYANGNRYLTALYNFYEGQLVFETNMPKAEQFYLKADSLLAPFKTTEAYKFRARALHNYAVVRQFANDPKTMMAVLIDKAIPLMRLAGDKNYLAQYYGDVALVFMNQWQYDKAQSYYDEAIEILKQTPRKPDDAYLYIDAITNLLYLDRLVPAKKLINQIRSLIVPNTQLEINFQTVEGLYFKGARQYQNALASLDKGLAIANKMNSPYDQSKILFQKYKVYVAMGSYGQAKNQLLQVITTKGMKFNRNRLTYYYELGETYAKLGNMKEAYNWQKKYGVLLDSLAQSKMRDEINALEVRFKSAESQKKIGALNAANERARLQAKNDYLIRWLLIGIVLVLLVAVIVGWFFYRNSKKLALQKEQIYKQELENVAQQQQIKIAQAVLNGQEEERNRVARDLHDGLGGMLANVKLNLSDLANDAPHHGKNLALVVDQLDGSIKELRRIAHNMVPEMLLKLGLETSLKDLCESVPRETLAIHFQCFGIKNNTLLVPEQIAIYRIVQELLTNVVKHAQAKTVLLQCTQNETLFLITIEDDGKGFDSDRLIAKQGMGLFNIKNRIDYLNGKLEVLSAKNKRGTIINIELNVSA